MRYDGFWHKLDLNCHCNRFDEPWVEPKGKSDPVLLKIGSYNRLYSNDLFSHFSGAVVFALWEKEKHE